MVVGAEGNWFIGGKGESGGGVGQRVGAVRRGGVTGGDNGQEMTEGNTMIVN